MRPLRHKHRVVALPFTHNAEIPDEPCELLVGMLLRITVSCDQPVGSLWRRPEVTIMPLPPGLRAHASAARVERPALAHSTAVPNGRAANDATRAFSFDEVGAIARRFETFNPYDRRVVRAPILEVEPVSFGRALLPTTMTLPSIAPRIGCMSQNLARVRAASWRFIPILTVGR
jgi:hypothetical protein